MSCLACSTILWQKWVLHTTIQPFSFSLYQCNTHIYILDKATEGFFHILLIASAHFGFNLFWKTICGKCLWMHEWNNHRKQKSCLCQFTLLTATDRSWKQKIKTKITQATSCGPSEVGSQSSFTPSPPQQKRDDFGIFTLALATSCCCEIWSHRRLRCWYKSMCKCVVCTPPGLLCLFYNL